MAWSTDDSSGFLTHYQGTVVDAYFGTDPKYGDGEALLLNWEVKVDEVLEEGWEGDLPTNDDDDPVTIMSVACGKGWVTEDGGETAERPKGKSEFHSASWYGRILDVVLGKVENYGGKAHRTDGEPLVVDMGSHDDCTLHPEPGEEGEHNGCLLSILAGKGDSTEAEVWVGLTFEFAEVQVDFGPDKDEVKKGNKDARITSSRSVPIRWVPAEDEKPKAAKSRGKAKKAAKSKAKPAAEEAAEEPKSAKAEREAKKQRITERAKSKAKSDPFAFVDDDETRDALGEALTGADDYDAFVDAVLDLVEDEGLLEQVLDDSETGPWASKP